MLQGKSKTVSEKIAELDELMAWFDGDNFELAEALEKFSEAKKMADEIEHDLMEMKNTITVLSESFSKD